MGKPSRRLLLALVAVAATIAATACAPAAPAAPDLDEDLRAIEALTQHDIDAFQWGTVRSSSRAIETGEVYLSGSKLLRILQRQADGSWKMHRTMTVAEPAASE